MIFFHPGILIENKFIGTFIENRGKETESLPSVDLPTAEFSQVELESIQTLQLLRKETQPEHLQSVQNIDLEQLIQVELPQGEMPLLPEGATSTPEVYPIELSAPVEQRVQLKRVVSQPTQEICKSISIETNDTRKEVRKRREVLIKKVCKQFYLIFFQSINANFLFVIFFCISLFPKKWKSFS